MKVILRRALLTGLALVAWEALRRSEFISPILLAGPSDIVAAFLDSGEDFLIAFQQTLASIAAAIAITWTFGVAFGLAAGASPFAYAVAAPILVTLFAIPLITWYPLLMVWFGIGVGSKIAFATLIGFFPIALNTMDGVRLIDADYLRFARSIGARRWQTALLINLPLALPSILSGLRIGTALAVIGVIVTEMLASIGGLGFWISYHRTLFNTGHVYLGIVLAMGCVLIANAGLSRLQRRVAGAAAVPSHQTEA